MNMKMLLASSRRSVVRLGFAIACVGAVATTAVAAEPVARRVDFTDFHSGSIDAWLKQKGFEFERDAGTPEKIAMRADARGLELEALKPAQGLLVNKSMSASDFSTIEIEWGVEKFPAGASYEKKVNNEAIMVHVFFGSEKMPSGSMFVPDTPPFIGLFLCNGDRVGHAYTGKYFQKGGRYVCVDAAPAGETVVSRFNLKEGVRQIFGDKIADTVTGYSVSVDTSSIDGGKSSAFIKSISFLQ